MFVQLLISSPLLGHNWLLALRAMIGASYRSITASIHSSLYCEWLCCTLTVELLTKCKMWQLRVVYDMSTIHYRNWDCALWCYCCQIPMQYSLQIYLYLFN